MASGLTDQQALTVGSVTLNRPAGQLTQESGGFYISSANMSTATFGAGNQPTSFSGNPISGSISTSWDITQLASLLNFPAVSGGMQSASGSLVNKCTEVFHNMA